MMKKEVGETATMEGTEHWRTCCHKGRRSNMPVRKTYTGQFKGNVAIAAVKAEHTLSELATQYEVHPNQIKHWKSYLLEHVGELFEDQRRQKEKDKDAMLDELYKQIGQLKVELDWVKKKAATYCS
jgi:transposase